MNFPRHEIRKGNLNTVITFTLVNLKQKGKLQAILHVTNHQRIKGTKNWISTNNIRIELL